MKDILLYIDTYPQPVAPEAIDQAVAFAAAVGGDLTALAVQVDLRTPGNYLADHVAGLHALCADEEQKSLTAAGQGLAYFEEVCARRGVQGTGQVDTVDAHRVGDRLAGYARTRDLCLIPIADHLAEERAFAETVIFGSGRPVLAYRPTGGHLMFGELKTVVIAWDASPHAARAMGDALPILQAASEVRIVTVLNDKLPVRAGATQEAVRHLRAHGIAPIADEIQGGGRHAGSAIADYARDTAADLIVMGAYGRSRLREFVLGGATRTLLTELKTPLFLAR